MMISLICGYFEESRPDFSGFEDRVFSISLQQCGENYTQVNDKGFGFIVAGGNAGGR
jgi:hypothetical protein